MLEFTVSEYLFLIIHLGKAKHVVFPLIRAGERIQLRKCCSTGYRFHPHVVLFRGVDGTGMQLPGEWLFLCHFF